MIATPASEIIITLSGDDLDYDIGSSRFLTVEAVYGGDSLPLVDEYEFTIKDLMGK